MHKNYYIKNVFEKNVGKLCQWTGNCLYPPVCPVCGRLLTVEEMNRYPMHPYCMKKLRLVTDPRCLKCGKPILNEQTELCFDCMKRPKSFERGYGLWQYDEASSNAVFRFKYGKKREYADFFVEAMVRFYGGWIRSLNVQQLIPVPVSKDRLRTRGFNQAGLLAEGLGEKLYLSVNDKALVRRHRTTPQKSLGKEERRKNIADAFAAIPTELKGIRRVLLIDDIYTTGATIEYCTRCLKSAGVEKVWFLTLCIGGTF